MEPSNRSNHNEIYKLYEQAQAFSTSPLTDPSWGQESEHLIYNDQNEEHSQINVDELLATQKKGSNN